MATTWRPYPVDEESQTRKDRANESQNDSPSNDGDHDAGKPGSMHESASIPNLDEPGSKIWLPYLSISEKYDKDLVEGWRDDMDAFLIFAALFSASVTAFVIDSYKFLEQDSGSVTVDVLLQISQQIAHGSQATAATRPMFSASTTQYSTVNAFWFLSLAFSLVCALAAVLVKQWARYYIQAPRSIPSLSERARMRQFLFKNMQTWKLELLVDTIPILLHISLILFFIGLLFFLNIIDQTIFSYMMCFSAICGVAYSLLTFGPLFFPGCPYRTPFSQLIAISLHQTWVAISWVILYATMAFLRSVHAIGSLRNLRTQQDILGIWNAWRDLPNKLWIAVAKKWNHLKKFVCHLFQRFFNALTLFRPSYVLQRKRSQLVNFEERRRSLAVTQSHTHYVNALRWAIEFSTNETDLIGIIQAVPDFVKSLAEEQRRNQRYADVGNRLYLAQSLLWRTGIKRHILRLLGDCVDRKAIKTQMRGVAQSCFEALHWLTRCPATFFGDQDTSHPRVLLQPSLLDSEYQNPHIDFTIDPPDDNALLWRCTLSSLVLDQIYQTEKSLWGFTMKASPTGLQEARVMLNNADQIASLLRWSSFPAKDSGSKVLLIELLDAIPSLLPEEQSAGGIRIHTLKNFQQFRERWVLWVLKHAMGPIFSDLSMPSPQYLLVLNNLYDAATHLQWFPNSTIRSQLTVFELLDNVIHWQEWLNGRSLTSNRISEALLSSYVSVIFGPGFHEQLHSHSREEIHASFIKSVQVQGGNSRVRGRQRGTSFRDIHIQFRHYSIIITRLVSSLQRIDSEWPESHIAVRYADAFASMIGGIIQCRLAENARHQKKDIEVGMDHIKETRILRKLLRHRSDATSAAIVEMLDDTSNKLGYRIVDVEAVAEHPEGRDVQSLALTPRLIYHPKITGTHGQSRNGQTTNHQPHEERGVLPHALPQVGEDVQSIIVEPLSPAMSENSLLSLPIPPDIEEGSPKVIPHIEDVETAQQHSISDAASDSDEFDESFLRTTQIPNRPDTAGAKERPTDAHPFRDGKTPPYASILLAVEREIEEFADLDITLGDDESLEHPQESDDMEFDKPSDSTVIQSDSSGSLSPTANRVLPRSEVTGTMGTPDGSTTSLESISSIASSSTLLSPTVIGTETEKDQINFECISKREEGDD